MVDGGDCEFAGLGLLWVRFAGLGFVCDLVVVVVGGDGCGCG